MKVNQHQSNDPSPAAPTNKYLVEYELPRQFGETGDPMLDPSIVSRIKFQQSYERRNWQGMNVSFAGVPGTSPNLNERSLQTFHNEKAHMQSQEKLIDIFQQIQQQMQPGMQVASNKDYLRFVLLDKIKHQKDEKGNPIYDESLLKKINALPVSSSNMYSKESLKGKHSHPSYKMLNCDSRLVKFVLELNGMKSTDRHDWDVLWTHTTGKSYFYERLTKNQKVNHFPMSIELTRKDKMIQNIRKQQERQYRDQLQFVPQTFVMPENYTEFLQAFKEEEHKQRHLILQSNGQTVDGSRPLTKNIWISKPTNSSRGRGIVIITNPDQVQKQEQCVVQRYIDNPLLCFGHKFDMRLYVVVTSFEPLRIYLYREGLARFASEQYQNQDLSNTDQAKYCHLTNYSINKNNVNYVGNDNANDDDAGFKWSLSALCQHFTAQGIDTNLMWAKIYDVIIKSLVSIDEQTRSQMLKNNMSRNNCFELFGYDILLDANLNPWLLEVNLSPSLGIDSPLDLKIKGNLLKDTFNLVGVKKSQPPPTHYSQQSEHLLYQPAKERRMPSTLTKGRKSSLKNNQSSSLKHETQLADAIHSKIQSCEDLNWLQKEYLNKFLHLAPKNKQIVIESMLEHQRRSNFVRIFPCKQSDVYDSLFAQGNARKQVQKAYNVLFDEVFCSFGDIARQINLECAVASGTSSNISRDQSLSNLQVKAAPTSRKIVIELVHEYLKRVQMVVTQLVNIGVSSLSDSVREALHLTVKLIQEPYLKLDSSLHQSQEHHTLQQSQSQKSLETDQKYKVDLQECVVKIQDACAQLKVQIKNCSQYDQGTTQILAKYQPALLVTELDRQASKLINTHSYLWLPTRVKDKESKQVLSVLQTYLTRHLLRIDQTTSLNQQTLKSETIRSASYCNQQQHVVSSRLILQRQSTPGLAIHTSIQKAQTRKPSTSQLKKRKERSNKECLTHGSSQNPSRTQGVWLTNQQDELLPQIQAPLTHGSAAVERPRASLTEMSLNKRDSQNTAFMKILSKLLQQKTPLQPGQSYAAIVKAEIHQQQLLQQKQ